MRATLVTAGERLELVCEIPWVGDLLAEGAAGALHADRDGRATVHVRVERRSAPFDVSARRLLARGVWARSGEVVVENVCTSGFDLLARRTDAGAELTYRWRPPTRERAASLLLRSRFHLLARAVLMQYPALWWAGTRGRAPLHASACVAASSVPLVTAQSGVGRSTLILAEAASGGLATADNLGVGDGSVVWGLVEPVRTAGGGGRRMSHGRQEQPLRGRVEALEPDCVIVLERGGGPTSLEPCSTEAAARALVSSTYMAGELRRYWGFAATLAAGTGAGPPHPPVTDVAETFAVRLPRFVLSLGKDRPSDLSQLLESAEVAA
jgi:hypothetical protein